VGPVWWQGTVYLKDITLLELVPVTLSLFMWGKQLENKTVLFKIEKSTLVVIINKVF